MRLIAVMIFASMSAQLPAADTHAPAKAPAKACSQDQSLRQIGSKEGTYGSFAVPNAVL